MKGAIIANSTKNCEDCMEHDKLPGLDTPVCQNPLEFSRLDD